MSEVQQFFIKEVIRHLRSMPMVDALPFLRGMIESVSDKEVTAKLQAVYISLFESDRQLELIQTGQLKFELGSQVGGQP